MKAGIIAAGEGSRLRSEGIDLPKPLVRINGVPLIERLIRTFLANGITEIACIVNDSSLDVKRHVEAQKFPATIRFVVETTPSSMHSLFALAPHLAGDRFLLSTVDPIFRNDEFEQYLRYGAASASDGVLAVTGFVDDESPLYVRLSGEKVIEGFSKDEPTSWVTGGIYIFSPSIFREMEPALRSGIERLRKFLAHLVARGYRLEGYPFSKIIDVDHVADVATAQEWLAAMPVSPRSASV